jgi:hypothetical protein
MKNTKSETVIKRLLGFIEQENWEHGHRLFSLEISHDGQQWEVRLCDGDDDYESRDVEICLALRGAMNRCCCAWWNLAKKEGDPDVRRNLKETHRSLAAVANFNFRRRPRRHSPDKHSPDSPCNS